MITSFSSPKTKILSTEQTKSYHENITNNLSEDYSFNKISDNINSNEAISNIIDVINDNNLNIFYEDDSNNFKHNIDQLNLKFYLETEKILTTSNSQTTYNSNILFLILFKQINLYIKEIERLNVIILESIRDSPSLKKRLAIINRQKTDFEMKEQIIKSLKFSVISLEKKLSELLMSENKLKQENQKLLQEKQFYIEKCNNKNNNKNSNNNSNNINENKNEEKETKKEKEKDKNIMFIMHRRTYSAQNEGIIGENCLNKKTNKASQGVLKHSVKKSSRINQTSLTTVSSPNGTDNCTYQGSIGYSSKRSKNPGASNQKIIRSVKFEMHEKEKNSKNKGNNCNKNKSNSKFELTLGNEAEGSFMKNKSSLLNSTTARHQTTTSATIHEDENCIIFDENEELNLMESLLIEVKDYLEGKKNKILEKKEGCLNNIIKNISFKAYESKKK